MAAKKNKFIEQSSEQDSSVADRPDRKERKKEKKPAAERPVSNRFAFLRDERFQKIFGGALLLGALYLLIAFTSFLFTWKADQDKVESMSWLAFVFSSSDVVVENWLGKMGALLSHLFIHSGFGIASYLFILNFFIFGFRLITGIQLLPAGKMIKLSLLGLILVSATLGFLFHTGEWIFLGGAFGFHLNGWLIASLGKIGTLLLLGFSYFIIVVVYFNPSFLIKRKEALQDGDVPPLDEEGKINIYNPTKEEDIIAEKKSQTIDLSRPQEEIPVSRVDDEIRNEEVITEIVLAEHEAEKAAATEAEELSSTVTTADDETASDELLIEIPDHGEGELNEDEVKNRLMEFGEYDPTLELSSYKLPSLDMLESYGGGTIVINKEELEQNKNRILDTLRNYNIEIAKIKATVGPTVTLYEIIPAPGVRISKIKNLEDDIALSLSALGIRIIAPIPGKGTIGIEVPNSKAEIVSMRSVVASEKFQHSDMELPVVLGKTISNETFVTDLAKMPHLLMAGATGQGKSVGLNAILVSILYKKHPSQVKFVLVDPKKVELTLFNKIERHFLAKLPDTDEAIITENKKVVHTINSLCIEMDARYELLKDAGVRNIKEYNAKFIQRRLNPEHGHKFLPYIVLVVDEFADLIMTAGKEIETPIARLAQLARAIGIHLIIATQRPSVNIITGTIKANFPARIAFRVTSKIDSRTILDSGGAEQLIGRGDMLFSTGNDLIRIQCAFVDTPEVDQICEYIGGQRAYPSAFLLPEYVGEESDELGGAGDDGDRDDLFEDAARIVVSTQQGSASLLQRKMKLGYNRAGRIIDQLEAVGIIGPFKGSKAREVLIKDVQVLEQFLNSLKNKDTNL
ncbi:MAG TPA: DNA translocase FtsK 4TM domain-containing protein [Flavobacteriales bacterium]|nr:DNA translocase FtsK 4TM domain-containing protein [Flavobacteriales bacterium]